MELPFVCDVAAKLFSLVNCKFKCDTLLKKMHY